MPLRGLPQRKGRGTSFKCHTSEVRRVDCSRVSYKWAVASLDPLSPPTLCLFLPLPLPLSVAHACMWVWVPINRLPEAIERCLQTILSVIFP